jgi:hypothetical protein
VRVFHQASCLPLPPHRMPCAECMGAGTLPYMAPELLVGGLAGPVAQHATNRVDIYRWGCIRKMAERRSHPVNKRCWNHGLLANA